MSTERGGVQIKKDRAQNGALRNSERERLRRRERDEVGWKQLMCGMIG